jgi:hypothetical protein
MSKLTLDLNALGVESFSISAAGDPSQWAAAERITAFSCLTAQNGGGADTFVCVRPQGGTHAETYISCVYDPAALTEAYPCKTTR